MFGEQTFAQLRTGFIQTRCGDVGVALSYNSLFSTACDLGPRQYLHGDYSVLCVCVYVCVYVHIYACVKY